MSAEELRRELTIRALEQALSVTYFFIALSGAAVAFVMQADILRNVDTTWERLVVTFSVFAFLISCACGIVVCMRAPVLLMQNKVSLDDSWLKIFGGLNVLMFFFGLLSLGTFALGLLWGGLQVAAG